MNVALRQSGASVPMRALDVTGMFGIGDCLHQRAIVREMLKSQPVTLQSFYTAMYHDLAVEGLRVVMRDRIKPRIKDRGNAVQGRSVAISKTRIGYTPEAIRQHGSILAAMYASVGLKMPERPDFSLPVKDEWRAAARRMIEGRNPAGKPLMVYRPIVQNSVWACPARSPDPEAYAEIYRSLRDRFFVVSVCDLTTGGERIVGPETDVDVRFHKGECDFETLAGLFAEAAIVFANPGFAPVLAQAVGTPNVIVYGANESFRTTNRDGAHLAPTLAIEPVTPCECHARTCRCSKEIDMPTALARVGAFVAEQTGVQRMEVVKPARPRVLIFATTYIDTPERLRLTDQWIGLHKRLNPDCDFLIVDSASPLPPAVDTKHGPVKIFDFGDNIGHLSRNGPGGPNTKGRDGWGRAFCKGLELAIEGGYDYAVHIEGDSLFRLKVMPIVEGMRRDGVQVASVPVEGTKRKEVGWVETGLMFFDCRFVKESDFIARYDWPNRKETPTPEKVIFSMLGRDLKMMPWRAERGDKSQITLDNVNRLDWVTHCHGRPEVSDRFFEATMAEAEERAATVPTPPAAPAVSVAAVRLNFGCGTNKLPGWRNFDADVNITKRLPFADASADFILAEHVVEHVEYSQALAFMRECRRVLKPGGTARFAVPSIEKVWRNADDEYFEFASRWAKGKHMRAAIDALLNCHGHKAPWTESLLLVTAYQAGFENVVACEPGQSDIADLVGVEGHVRVIGERFNWIETVVVEAS